ncbi:hypothetical protein Clacol_009429 [Clathrus columnatus]|uniref:Uncharacterized protein n=1 Tax=Clathrus columnatus TaxID=1419009 RepID=A0AAV5APR4_9AGAM|nr:hypothetical protein Clacol_009429 [Clathrus columnatus]
MAFNFNYNVNTNNNGSASNYPRTATALTSADGEKLIPPAALDKFFPSPQEPTGKSLGACKQAIFADHILDKCGLCQFICSSPSPKPRSKSIKFPPGPNHEHGLTYDADQAVVTDPEMRNLHMQDNHRNMTPGMRADVNSISSAHSRCPTSITHASTDHTPLPCHYSPSQDATSIPDNEPGIYEQISRNVWRCTYQECKTVTRGTRNRTRHIGKHAKQEHKLIDEGILKRKDAIAIPKAQMLTYEWNSALPPAFSRFLLKPVMTQLSFVDSEVDDKFQEPQPWGTGNKKSFNNWSNEDAPIVPPRSRSIIIRPPATSPSPPPPELPPKKETYPNRNRTKDIKPYTGLEGDTDGGRWKRDWGIPEEDWDLNGSKYTDEGSWGKGWGSPPRNNNNIAPRSHPIVTHPPASPPPAPSELPPKNLNHDRTDIEPYLDNGIWDKSEKDYDLDDSKHTDAGGWGKGWGPPEKDYSLDDGKYSESDALGRGKARDISVRKATISKSPSRSPSPSGSSPVRENKADAFFIPPIFGNSEGYYLQFHELLRPGPNKINWDVTQSPYEFVYYRKGKHVPNLGPGCPFCEYRNVQIPTKWTVTIGMVLWSIYVQLVLAPIAPEDWFDLADGRDYPHQMKVIASKKRADIRDNPRASRLTWGDMLEKKVYFGGIVDFVEKPAHGGNLPTFIVKFEE